MQKTYIIAEGGINHNGDINLAKQLIDIASVAGCDCFKLQKRTPDLCVPEDQKNKLRDTPWGRIKYIDYKKKIEFGKEEYDILSDYCKERRIGFASSIWDLDSLGFMSNYDVAFMKIPSALITNEKLFVATAKWCDENDKPFVFSLGMSSGEEIDQAIQWAQQYVKNSNNIWALWCCSAYPADLKNLNLSTIQKLNKKYNNIRIGYSSHEYRLVTCISSIFLGASILEKHLAIDRFKFWGTDQLSSVDPHGLIKLVRGVRQLEESYGSPNLTYTEDEIPYRKKLRGY